MRLQITGQIAVYLRKKACNGTKKEGADGYVIAFRN